METCMPKSPVLKQMRRNNCGKKLTEYKYSELSYYSVIVAGYSAIFTRDNSNRSYRSLLK